MAQDAGEIRQQLTHDREELAETVQALARKADVKSRLREKVAAEKEQLQHRAEEITEKVKHLTPDQAKAGLESASGTVQEKPLPYAVAGAVVGGLLLGWLVGRRGGRKKAEKKMVKRILAAGSAGIALRRRGKDAAVNGRSVRVGVATGSPAEASNGHRSAAPHGESAT